MFENETLEHYKTCLHIKICRKTANLLPLYEYGLKDARELIRDILILRGYLNSVDRYIRDRATLTKRQLLCMVQFCEQAVEEVGEDYQIIYLDFVPHPHITIGTIPEVETILSFIPVPIVTIEVAIQLSFIPAPIVTLVEGTVVSFVPKPIVTITEVVIIKLSFIPEPVVKVNTNEDTVLTKLSFVPKPIVAITEVAIIEMSFIPTPIVKVNINESSILTRLSFIPKPIVKMLQYDDDYTENNAVLSFVPLPIVNIGTPIVITEMPDASVSLYDAALATIPLIIEVPDVSVSDDENKTMGELYYFGIIPAVDISQRPSAETINIAALSKVVLSTLLPDDLHIKFPDVAGFAVFAIPETAKPRKSYYISDQNKGVIGGLYTDPQANLFPGDVPKIYDTRPYMLYISSYVTRIEKVITVRAAEYNPRYQSGYLPLDEIV